MMPPRMFVSAVFEGRKADFLDLLVKAGGDNLKQFLQHCDGFPSNACANEVQEWLQRHAESPQTYHIGTLRDDLNVIRDEYRLRVAIGKYVDRRQAAGAWLDADAVMIHREIRDFVRTQSDLPQGPRPSEPWLLRVMEWLDVSRMFATLAAPPTILACLFVWWFGMSWWSLFWLASVIALVLAILLFAVIRYYEITEGDLVVTPKPGHIAALVEDEDFAIQNQYTMLAPVRDSWFRRLNLRFVLWLANGFSKHWYRSGQLVGIDTIHFARFHLIDNGRRMLFMSDFDGGWERYLFDFLGVGSLAVVPIWTHLHGCPKTRFLRFPTKGFAQRFIPLTRAYQRPTQLWYSALEHLTVAEIKRHQKIRVGLFGRINRRTSEQWLKLI
jgi:hypothetical protein